MSLPTNIAVMQNAKAKQAFAERFNRALDEIDAPPKGDGRQIYVKQLFGVSQPGARKWLEGESMPQPSKIGTIVAKLNAKCPHLPPIREEWLLFGRGPMREPIGATPSTDPETDLLNRFRELNAQGQLELLVYADFLKTRHPLVKDDLAPMRIRGSHYMSADEQAEMHRALQERDSPRYNFTEKRDEPKQKPARGKAATKRRRVA